MSKVGAQIGNKNAKKPFNRFVKHNDDLYEIFDDNQNVSCFVCSVGFDKVKDHRWCAGWEKDTESFYFKKSDYSDGTKKTVRMHQHIFGQVREGFSVDHINQNSLDNRVCNLREASHSKQARNRSTASKHGILICWDESKKRFFLQFLGHHFKTSKDKSDLLPLRDAILFLYDNELVSTEWLVERRFKARHQEIIDLYTSLKSRD